MDKSRGAAAGRLSLTFISGSAERTTAAGKIIGDCLRPGDVVALIGELGSGKTCLTQGIARGLGVPEGYRITSPTFTLINEYPGRTRLYHLDVYRLAGSDDLVDMGYEEYFYGDGVAVIEWAEKVEELLPEDSLVIVLRYLDESSREIRIEGPAEKAELIFHALREGGFC